jgi:DNA-binding transcriptional ArsR family regulator
MSICAEQQAEGGTAEAEPSADRPLSEEAVEAVVDTLGVLADETRVRLIEVLKHRGGATVGALTDCVPVTQQSVSKQLAILRRAGIVKRRREGMCVRYELADWTGWWLIDQLAGALGAE